MALRVGSRVVLAEDTDPEPEVGTVLEVRERGSYLVRWPTGWAVDMEHHSTFLTEVHASLTPRRPEMSKQNLSVRVEVQIDVDEHTDLKRVRESLARRAKDAVLSYPGASLILVHSATVLRRS